MIKEEIKSSRQKQNPKEISHKSILDKELMEGSKVSRFISLKEELSFKGLVSQIQKGKLINTPHQDYTKEVIGIDESGRIIEENLDITDSHHASSTIRIAKKIGKNIETSISPFITAVEAIKKGIIIIQTENARALIYLPNKITKEQLESLQKSLESKTYYFMSLITQDRIIEEVNLLNVIAYAASLIESEEISLQVHK